MKVVKVGSTQIKGHSITRHTAPGNEQELIDLANRLAANPTKSERLLKAALTERGYTFEFQRPMHGYVADFYFPQGQWVVELDGAVHRLRKEKDERRDAALRSKGIRTLRIESHRVFESINLVIKEIALTCKLDKPKKKKKRKRKGFRQDEFRPTGASLLDQFMFATAGI